MTVRLAPIRRGDPRTITVTVLNPDGDPINLSGSTWSSTIGRSASSTRQTTVMVNTSQASAGVLALTISGDQSRLFELSLVGDLQGSDFGTILTFEAVVLPDVTRDQEPSGGLVDNITLTWGGLHNTLSENVLGILVPNGGQLMGSVVDGVISIDVPKTLWGVDENGEAYFDPAGAVPGEEAWLIFEPGGHPVLVPLATVGAPTVTLTMSVV